MKQSMKRRDFMKTLGFGAAAFGLLSVTKNNFAQAEEGRRSKDAGATDAIVSEKEDTAKAVGYVADYKKSKKAGESKCQTCALYTKTKDINGVEYGGCPLFQKKLVAANAYCNSYAKKPG